MTWLEGHSLAQTVFTNLYLHDPNLIEDRPLKAFSVCMLKTVDLIKDRINRAGVYEEVQYSKFWILFSFGHSFDYNTNDNSLLIVLISQPHISLSLVLHVIIKSMKR